MAWCDVGVVGSWWGGGGGGVVCGGGGVWVVGLGRRGGWATIVVSKMYYFHTLFKRGDSAHFTLRKNNDSSINSAATSLSDSRYILVIDDGLRSRNLREKKTSTTDEWHTRKHIIKTNFTPSLTLHTHAHTHTH